MCPDMEVTGRMGHPFLACPGFAILTTAAFHSRYQDNSGHLPYHLHLPRSPQPVSKENSLKLGLFGAFPLPLPPVSRGFHIPEVSSSPRHTGWPEGTWESPSPHWEPVKKVKVHLE